MPAPIDFTTPRSADELVEERTALRSSWAAALAALRAGVEAGTGEPDTFYRIGTFTTASGATTALRNLKRRGDIGAVGEFLVEPRTVVSAAGERTSELWAAVPSDALQPADPADA